MNSYCTSDVDILRQACLKFRELLISSTKTEALVTTRKGKWKMKYISIDPFDYVTIASVCMGIYKTKYLEEDWQVKLNGGSEWKKAKFVDGNMEVWMNKGWVKEGVLEDKVTEKQFIKSPIAKVPPKGIEENYCKASMQWLEWKARSNNIIIQHALNGGEKSLPGTRYKLDGHCETINTAFEYHGCVFHGCPACFFSVDREETKHPFTDQSMLELYALTMKKKAYIEGLGMKHVCIWEHQFKEECQTNPDLGAFIDNFDIADRLDPRESFFGGRTNASQLYYRTKD